MRKIKVFDCSNSIERPTHRELSLCPIENTIVRDLKKYATKYGFEFVDDKDTADIMFTNDVFPKELINLNIPKVKRMDGVFFQNESKDRNLSLNESARIADKVIFISQFSKDSYYNLYEDNLKSDIVIVNNVDNKIFNKKKKQSNKLKYFCACCSNWDREEKRLNSIRDFAKNIKEKIYLIGKCNKEIPKNIINCGYCNENNINKILEKSDAFVNFSYKDAGSKTVLQAVSKGLPVLFADSGGVKELVYSGIGVPDNKKYIFENKIPKLTFDNIEPYYSLFKEQFSNLSKKGREYNNNYQKTIGEYFKVIREVYNNYKLKKDKLFGILTRPALELQIQGKVNACLIDMNNLKKLNQLLGYNKVNKIIYNIFQEFKKEDCICGRWFSGDEILIIHKDIKMKISLLKHISHTKGMTFKEYYFINETLETISKKIGECKNNEPL